MEDKFKNYRVLVISENEDDYNDLVGKFGQVDYFKSIVCASNYFKVNESIINQYDFIFLGPSLADYYTDGSYKKFLKSLVKSDDLVVFDYEEEKKIKGRLILANNRTFDNIEDYFFVGWTRLLPKVKERLAQKEKKSFKLQTGAKRNIFISKNLKNIRMLFYVREENLESIKAYVKNMGFKNIDFYTYQFGDLNIDDKFLVEKLGTYDVVVLPSSGHLRLKNEASQQMLENGRMVVSLVYAFKNDYRDGVYSEKVRMNFTLSNDHHLEYKYCYGMVGTGQEVEREIALFNTILVEYANFLREAKIIDFEPCVLKDVKYYNKLVKRYREKQQLIRLKEQARRKKVDIDEKAKIILYDKLVRNVQRFLDYQEQGIKRKTPEICLRKKEDVIEITLYLQGRVKQRIFIPNENVADGIRLFDLQYCISENGKWQMLEPKKVGIYTSFWEDECSIARMNEVEMKNFEEIVHKVNMVLESVLNDLENGPKEDNVYSLKKKNKKRRK